MHSILYRHKNNITLTHLTSEKCLGRVYWPGYHPETPILARDYLLHTFDI
jgi:hypothetical protein